MTKKKIIILLVLFTIITISHNICYMVNDFTISLSKENIKLRGSTILYITGNGNFKIFIDNENVIKISTNKIESLNGTTEVGIIGISSGTSNVIVISEDGTEKTLTVSVGDSDKNEVNISQETNCEIENVEDKTNNQITESILKSSKAYLSNLIVAPVDFTGFKYDKFTGYEVIVENDVTSVQITAVPKENSSYVVEGNENLKEGNNKVLVKVVSEDETSTNTYEINIIRKEKTNDEITENEENSEIEMTNNIIKEDKDSKSNLIKIILIIVIILIVIIIIMFIIRKRRKKQFKKAGKHF